MMIVVATLAFANMRATMALAASRLAIRKLAVS
jgi:hypothetical protein